MKYVDEFRDGALAKKLASEIARTVQPGRRYRLMEFCGGHTHALWRYGILPMLPSSIEMVHGPGCPVCVLPIGRLMQAMALAARPEVILCTFGDMLRVPGRDRRTLMGVKAEGADVRIVYGAGDALALAEKDPTRQVVFFAVGFETTTPPTALVIEQAMQAGLENFSVLCNHVLTPAAIHAIMHPANPDDPPVFVDGFIGPGHVSTVIGTAPYEPFAREHKKPVVVSGFEPLDLMQSILMLVRQLNDGRAEVENEYARAANRQGNTKAQALMERVFERRAQFEWRGLGTLPDSALQLRERYAAWDAERKWNIPYEPVADHRSCACPDILRGQKKPTDCKIFGTACTPESPIGSCMVSPEGACAAYYSYAQIRKKPLEVVGA